MFFLIKKLITNLFVTTLIINKKLFSLITKATKNLFVTKITALGRYKRLFKRLKNSRIAIVSSGFPHTHMKDSPGVEPSSPRRAPDFVGHESIYSCPHLCCDRMRLFIQSGSPVVRADAGVAASIIPYPSTLFKYFGDLRHAYPSALPPPHPHSLPSTHIPCPLA